MSIIQPTIDDCQAHLHRLGWSVGDVLIRSEIGQLWMVFAHRGEQRIVAKTMSQSDAWREATRMVLAL